MTSKKYTIDRKRHVLDAQGQSMGRLATQIALLLRGKNKPTYQPHIDAGDFVHITNAGQLNFTGKKLDQKVYHRHSGYPGGIKTTKLRDMVEKDPSDAIKRAVRLMLPDTKLRKGMLKRLTVEK